MDRPSLVFHKASDQIMLIIDSNEGGTSPTVSTSMNSDTDRSADADALSKRIVRTGAHGEACLLMFSGGRDSSGEVPRGL